MCLSNWKERLWRQWTDGAVKGRGKWGSNGETMGHSERLLRQEIAQSAWKLMGMISRKGNLRMKERRTARAVALNEQEGIEPSA